MYEWLITEYDLLPACFALNCRCKWVVTRWKHTEQGWKRIWQGTQICNF